ncbi:RDD family protein [Actinomadura yumaensis]|uniref:RDD family protein n=1 Tax=Actinomadura yumaensis TaxID=111807 RepID=A0ABW2D0N4_9ACTN
MAELVTGEAVALDIRVARLASRGCALLLDLFVQFSILNAALYVTAMTSIVADEAWTVGLSLLVTVLVIVGYPCLLETLTRGRTLGKMAVGLRTVADDGGPVRFRQTLVRALAGFLEFWTLYGAPAMITSLCSSRGKRLGDLFAGTIVIQERVPSSSFFGPVAVMPPQLAGWGRSLELSMLSDDLAMTARSYLTRFWELLPEVRDSLGQRIAAQVFEVVSPPPPPGVRPEILLSAVLAERRRREEWRLAERRARRMRHAGHHPGWQGFAEPAAAPAMAMAGAPVAAHAHPPGPAAPPPFSAPGPGQPRFVPPSDYGAGPYRGHLTPTPQPAPQPTPQPGPYAAPQPGPHAGPQPGPHAGPQAGPQTGSYAAPQSGSYAGPPSGPHAAPYVGPPPS